MVHFGHWDFWSEDEKEILRAVMNRGLKYGDIASQLRLLLPNRSYRSCFEEARRLKLVQRRYQAVLQRLPEIILTEPEKAWLACAIDGEGSIYLYQREDSRLCHYCLKVVNTNKAFVDRFKELTGATTERMVEQGKYNPNSKRRYEAQITERARIYAILQTILPYLIIKQRHARLAMRLIEIQDEIRFSKKSWYERTTPTVEQLELYKEIRLLNKKGVVV